MAVALSSILLLVDKTMHVSELVTSLAAMPVASG